MKIEDPKHLMKLISAITMADGGIYYGARSKNPFFAMNMVTDNVDYVNLCADIINNITSTTITERGVDGNRRPQVRLQSKSHPYFKAIRDRIYVGNYKSLDWHALNMLDEQVLAIFYMSDGSLFTEMPNPKKGLVNPSYNVTLNMKRLCYADQFLLKKAFKEKFDLEWNINRQYNYHYMRLRSKDVDRFMGMVAPWILPSFQYKLKNNFRVVGPQGTEVVI